jgi:hypothetical protein
VSFYVVNDDGSEDKFAEGVIKLVVRKSSCKDGALHFKLVNASGDEDFVPCKVVMSTAKSNVYKVVTCLYF